MAFTLLTGAAILFAGCTKVVEGCNDSTATNYNSKATKDNGSCMYAGTLLFWCNANNGIITVNINGNIGFINMYYPTYNPDFGAAGCASFTLSPGTYNYTASNTTGSNWSGSITISKNTLQKLLLY